MSVNNPSRRRIPAALIWIAIPLAIAGMAFAWWTISPLFISTRIEESFPTAAAISQPAVAPTTPVIRATAAPAAAPAAVVAPTAMTEPSVAPSQPTAVPAEPVALASGSFTVIDSLHGAEGTATIYALPDGQRVLRLEGFRAQNGPDLRIGLAGHPMPRSSAELHDTGTGYIELSGLKASEGSQNYTLPAELDLEGFRSVVIYCRAFSVVFSTAQLELL